MKKIYWIKIILDMIFMAFAGLMAGFCIFLFLMMFAGSTYYIALHNTDKFNDIAITEFCSGYKQ